MHFRSLTVTKIPFEQIVPLVMLSQVYYGEMEIEQGCHCLR